jgi:hypothetical protein
MAETHLNFLKYAIFLQIINLGMHIYENVPY